MDPTNKKYRGFVENCQRGTETISINGKTYHGSWIYGNNHIVEDQEEDYIIQTFDFKDGPTSDYSGYLEGSLIVPNTLCVSTGETDKLGHIVYSNDILKVRDCDNSVRFIRVEWTEKSGFAQYFVQGCRTPTYDYSRSEVVGTIFDDFETVKKQSLSIQKGDLVKVINSGCCYSIYSDWVNKNARGYSVYFVYNRSLSTITDKHERFKVVAVAPHLDRQNEILCLIQSIINGECYLINVDGVESVDS